MITSHTCPTPAKCLLFALSCAFAVVALPAASFAADSAAADQATTLPVTATVEKGAATDTGPFSVKLKNTSKDSLAVNVKILLAVAGHAENKAKTLPEQSVKAGETVTVPGLALGDKVVVSAKGHAPLTVTVK